MRKRTNIVESTVSMHQILQAGKEMINDAIHPEEVLKRINEKFLKQAGIKYIVENENYQKVIPDIIYQTDEPQDIQSTPADQAVYMANKRVIFVCDRASRNHTIQAASEANGVVIEYSNWNVLSFPPAALSFNMAHADMAKYLELGVYKIYNIDFGTIVTLYYYNNKWRLSSANAYEIDNKIWIGDKTFRELIDEIFDIYQITMAELDKNWCYTIGFHHYEYHPFDGAGQKSMRAWFIRSVNIAEYNKSNTMEIGHSIDKLPAQQEDLELNVSAQNNAVATIEKIKDLCNKSYVRYINDPTTKPLYGFVLLSNKPEIIASSLIESDLQKKLRKYVCRRPPNDLSPEKRFNWMMINASMNKIEEKSEFRRLFPVTLPAGEKFDKLIADLANRIVNVFNKDIAFEETNFDKIVKFIIENMKKNSHFINRKPESIGIVQDYLRQQSFSYLYATIL